MTAPKALLLVLTLAACAPAVPDSGAGVGFGDYSDYLRQQEAQRQAALARPAPVAAPQGFSTERLGAAIDASENRNPQAPTGAPLSALGPAGGPQVGQIVTPGARPRGGAPAGIKQESGEMRPAGVAISDEQDFNAVSSRETIQSDAERLAQQRAQYQVVAPTALPTRTESGGPNIVQFALATQHSPGTQMYKRSSLFAKNPLVSCAKYASPDLAQEEFLASGGPERDRGGLDPDGDGFACGWDPRPFRTALR